MRRPVALVLATLVLAAGPALGVPTPAAAEDPRACRKDEPARIEQDPPAFALMGIPAAWQLSTGRSASGEVRVAVVDSGVDATNQHLSAAMAPGIDLVADGGDGTVDTFGHGTAIAAQIAARKVRGSGLVGVAPAVRIVPVRVYEGVDEGMVVPTAKRTAEGIDWAADQAGVRVIVVAQSTFSDDARLRSSVRRATRKGALVVASAGNSDTGQPNTVVFPAGYSEVLSVTALDAAGQPTDAAQHGVHVELAAPGQQVLTAFFASDCLLAGEQPASSYAAGYVAGVAALVAARHPEEGPADWEYRLLATALRPAGAEKDSLVGWGVVAPYDAINFVNDGSRGGPPNPRFPPAQERVAPAMPMPDPITDPGAAVGVVVGSILLAAGILFVGGMLFRRLRQSA